MQALDQSPHNLVDKDGGNLMSIRAKVFLTFVPMLIPIVTIIFVHLFGPYEGDPSYGPLMSALNLLHLEQPGYALHPGTPVHILGAIMLAIIWIVHLPFAGFLSLDSDVLLHPDFYLYWMNLVIAFLIAGARYYLGQQLLRATGSLAMAIAGQATIFMAFPFMISLPLVTPDSLIICTTTFFVALLVPAAFPNCSFYADNRYGILVGAVLGVCLATKITSVPLCILLLLLRDRKVLSYAIIALVVAFFVSTLPAIGLLSETAANYIEILSHTGSNGTGQTGAPTLAELVAHFKLLLVPGAGLLVTLGTCIPLIFLNYGLGSRADASFRFLFLLSVLAMLAQYALAIKNPGDRYLAPGYSVLALVYPALMYIARLRLPRVRVGIQTVIGFVMAAIMLEAVHSTSTWLGQTMRANRDNQQLLDKAVASKCLIISYYDAPTVEYRLMFGDETSGLRHSEALSKLYPSTVSYNIWRQRFQSFSSVLDIPAAMKILHSQKCIYFYGSTMDRMGGNFKISPERLSLIGRTYDGVIYSTALYRLRISPDSSWQDLGLPLE